MKVNRVHLIGSAIGILLLLPLIAMQFTAEVNWSIGDFIVMGMLLLGTGLLCELVMRKVKMPGKRILFCAIIIGICFLIWAELSVGIVENAMRYL